MPEPDLPPLNLSKEFIEAESANLPPMPNDYRRKFGNLIAGDTLEVLLDYPELMAKLGEIEEKNVKK